MTVAVERAVGVGMVLLIAGCGVRADAGPSGAVVDEAGTPVAGALVTLRDPSTGVATTVYTDEQGRYEFPHVPGDSLVLEARGPAAESSPRHERRGEVRSVVGEIRLEAPVAGLEPRASSYLGQIPDGPRKRQMTVDCGGCHTFDGVRMRKDGDHRGVEDWATALNLMLATAGQGTGFPIISGAWDPARDAHWLADAMAGASHPTDDPFPAELVARAGGAVLTEYDVPEPLDLAHDVAIDGEGNAIVTGMFTHRMYVLDPDSGSFQMVAIPVEGANPRAVDIDREGRWWVLLGAPMTVSSYDPRNGAWENHPIGMYPHSIALDSGGRVWFNGHFTVAPELFGVLDPADGSVETFEVPAAAETTESTIPYGLRVGPDDVIWGTQLRGNRLMRHDPATGTTRTFDFPTEHSGPRRPDVGPDGTIWIPTYGGNALVRFDPESEAFWEFPFPVPDAAPYVARVDQTRGTVWIGTGQADVVASFDPQTERFTLYPLPTRGALVRHIDVDERTGALWAVYSASPGIGGKVLRIELPTTPS